MIFTLEHVGLSAADSLTLKNWYVRTLGARVVFDNGRQPPAFLLSLGDTGTLIEVYPGDHAIEAKRNNLLHGWRHIALRVDSIESARDALRQLGAEFHEEIKPAAGGGRVLFFSDPEGNLLHLVERPQGWLKVEG